MQTKRKKRVAIRYGEQPARLAQTLPCLTLGRPEGTTLDREVFLQKHKDIVRLLKSGQSVRNTAKISGKGVSTVQRIKAALLTA